MTKEEQERLLEENYMIYIGKGPQATHIGSK
ncbi:hypothetical protein SDC9_93335 [bioreactor metagenome]|uniref:Uncharacterized protein n=1 Tax=bioreactor metagenome TaxID=1076179 RepID=A0A645A086_9ZZZZ